jgi:hypothetical protein
MAKIKTNSKRIGELLKDYLKELGKRGGSVKSEKKAKASRENGKKRKKKIASLALLLFLMSCGGSGGGGSSASNPLVGNWIQQFSNPANNFYVGVTDSSFTIQQGACTITGSISVDASTLHLSNVSETAGCVAQPPAFDCNYSMPTNNQLNVFCPSLTLSLDRS